MFSKKWVSVALLAVGAMMLSGCESVESLSEAFVKNESWEPQEADAISVKKNGSITEQINEVLDASYYSADELQNMISSEISSYNSQAGSEKVKLEKFEETEGSDQISVEISYASAEDFASFNNTEFYYGSMINAQLAGYLFDTGFQKVKNGEASGQVSSDDGIYDAMDKEVLILMAPMEVQVCGELVYVSSNADVLGSNLVDANGEMDETEREDLVLPSSDVYKRTHDKTFDEEQSNRRVYIIFEKE